MLWQPTQSLHWIHKTQPLPDYSIFGQLILVAGIIRSPEGDSCSGALYSAGPHTTFSMLAHPRSCRHTADALFDKQSQSPYHTFPFTHASQKEIKIPRQKPITSDQKERLTKEQTVVKMLKGGENWAPNSHLAPPCHSSITCQKFSFGKYLYSDADIPLSFNLEEKRKSWDKTFLQNFSPKRPKQKQTNLPEQAYQSNVIDIHGICCLCTRLPPKQEIIFHLREQTNCKNPFFTGFYLMFVSEIQTKHFRYTQQLS